MTTERRNKWVVIAAWSALVSIAGFLFAETYRSNAQEKTELRARVTALEVQAATQREQQRQFEATLLEFKATQLRFEQTVDRLQEGRRR